jgi:CheY-like chemotaxis protein
MQAPDSVLIIESDTALREGATELLAADGIDVQSVSSGPAALELLRDGLRPSVILVGLTMPDEDGWQFRSTQLADPSLKDIPTIALSTSASSKRTLRSEFTAVLYVMGSSFAAELVSAVRMVADRNRGA